MHSHLVFELCPIRLSVCHAMQYVVLIFTDRLLCIYHLLTHSLRGNALLSIVVNTWHEKESLDCFLVLIYLIVHLLFCGRIY